MKFLETYRPIVGSEEINLVGKVTKSRWITAGKLTKEFEKKIAKKIGSKNVIAVNSCTSGIDTILNVLNLKKGDEVITTLLTYISTINNIYNHGLKIKLIDVNIDDYTMSLDELKKNITKKTKLILVNHFSGIPSRIDKIEKIIKNKKIYIVEDAATSFGSKIGNKNIGSFKKSISVFSLQANKIITTGEGGFISLRNRKLAQKIREYINCGFSQTAWQRHSKINKSDVKISGKKYNFTDIGAAFGIAQLKKYQKLVSYRNKLRRIYNKEFSNSEIKKYLKIYKPNGNIKLSQYNYIILINRNKFKNLRDKLRNYLNKKKIGTTLHYITADKTSFYRKKLNFKNLKNSKFINDNIISIPFHNDMKIGDVYKVTKEIKKFFKKFK